MAHNQQWHADRATGIGGSEAASLLSDIIPVDYGCRRALWLRKSGIPADNPPQETEPMILGSLLEPMVRRLYSEETGYRVEEVKSKKHPLIDCLRVNVDGVIHAPDRAAGTLECKVVGRQMMHRISEYGLPSDYLVQVQHGNLIHGHTWGSFAIGVREDMLSYALVEQYCRQAGEPMPPVRKPKIIYFEIARSDATCELIEQEAEPFWNTLGDPGRIPERLEDPEDPRCGRCPWQVSCRGQQIVESVGEEITPIPRRRDLIPLRDEYIQRMGILNEAERLIEETKQRWISALGKTPAVSVPVEIDGKEKWKNVIHRVRSGKSTIDGNAMRAQYDHLRAKAIEAGLPGAELVPESGSFVKKGMPSAPLLLSGLLPKKEKKGTVPEAEESDD